MVDFQPTCENILIYIANKLKGAAEECNASSFYDKETSTSLPNGMRRITYKNYEQPYRKIQRSCSALYKLTNCKLLGYRDAPTRDHDGKKIAKIPSS